MEKVQFTFVVGIISCKLYILWLNQTDLIDRQQKAIVDIDINESIFVGKEPGIKMARLLTMPEFIFSIYEKALLIIQCRNVFVI